MMSVATTLQSNGVIRDDAVGPLHLDLCVDLCAADMDGVAKLPPAFVVACTLSTAGTTPGLKLAEGLIRLVRGTDYFETFVGFAQCPMCPKYSLRALGTENS